jgi:hypothetical protein
MKHKNRLHLARWRQQAPNEAQKPTTFGTLGGQAPNEAQKLTTLGTLEGQAPNEAQKPTTFGSLEAVSARKTEPNYA